MYFITTVDSKKKDTRCVGYFKSFTDADRVVVNNGYDIWETCYDYAVIENISEGIYKYDFHPVWYKYHKLAGGYVKCERPDFVTKDGGMGTIGFAIG